jgi:hypothetical protein
MEYDLHLVDLTFVPSVHNGVWMGLRGIDESLFPIIAPKLLSEVVGELQGPTAIYTDGSKRVRSELGYFWMIGTRTVLDCLDTVVFSLLKCAP